MNKIARLFIALTLVMPAFFGAAGAATCSRASLTRCLDSACGINVGANPAARCQLCGTSTAGVGATNTGLTNLSVGASSKNTISAKELKVAPSDPGARYAWATGECIKKISGCTVDDVSDIYDLLIENSCKAAGINASREELFAAAKKTKSKTTCDTEIRSCVVDAKRCGPGYTGCEDNANFDKFFSACVVNATGCDEYTSAIRTVLITARDTAIKNADTLLANIVNAYQTARETKLKTAEDSCRDNRAKNACIQTVCETNMKNKCAAGFASEKSMATLLCAFHDTACSRLK